ncbi:antiviral reverse transcriptase Drt4 [Photobacterium damselae]|uniref:antiviral reverse transcriptase Drt4 n=1 Tax=Photobacterium damselae TaxID=38293 RepID=UPI000D82EA26|nr:antiviral reverse transcriptase Drt4 [Photobacterium damselae]NVO74244.1 RNA-directed DNA polymerase [Photobacterium damselae subsp. damselae]SPY24324.1 Reverse transcriptase (RNA-dependent DNA polymerase) [Photobacterium damselae]
MINEKYLKDSLLRHNYFPLQKNKNEELPNIFNSDLLTPNIADKLCKISLRSGGYDHCTYNVTRFNNVHRSLAIPHPLPYSYLVKEIASNWDKLEHIENNENSIIRPSVHPDGRIIVMTYEQPNKQKKCYHQCVNGKKFIVRSDIANFYPSIYTHSIPWALMGVQEAKNNQRDGFANKLDYYQRMMKRNETIGIAIGPGTSNMISEIILFEVDKLLTDNGYNFSRAIDDYTAFCSTYEEAESFVRDLSEALSTYGLLLNIKKTEIKKLPKPTTVDWISDIGSRLSQRKKVNEFYCRRMLDYAVELQEKNPSGSILKYTVKSLISKSNNQARLGLLEYVSNLTMHYPILLPLLTNLLPYAAKKQGDNYYQSLIFTLNECIKNKSSDGMVWCLFYIRKYYDSSVDSKLAERIIATQDCMSILTLYLYDSHKDKVEKFANEVLARTLFDIDQYWILLYQLYFDKRIENPYKSYEKYLGLVKAKTDKAINMSNHDAKVFDTLKQEKVTFIELSFLNEDIKSRDNLLSKLMTRLLTKVVNKVEESAM